MKRILIINSILEITGGISLIVFPQLLFLNSEYDTVDVNLSKMYGIIAFLYGLICLIIYRFGQDEKLIKYSALSVLGFHVFISFHLYGMLQSGVINHIGPLVTHIVMVALCFIIYLKSI